MIQSHQPFTLLQNSPTMLLYVMAISNHQHVRNTVNNSLLHSSHQRWRQPFQEFALQWLDSIGRYFETLVPQLISHDGWNAIEVNISGSQERSHQMKPGRMTTPGPLGRKSASLLSLTPSQHSAFKPVGSFNGTPSKVCY